MGSFRDFAAALLERQGAAVEPVEPDGLEVLAPPPLRQALHLPELVRLGFGTELPEGAQRVGLEGDWLERFGGLLGERGRYATRAIRLDGALPAPGDPERLLNHGLELPNAVWRLRGVSPGWARALVLTFRFTALSDEKREGVLRFGFNQSTGAPLNAILDTLVPAGESADVDAGGGGAGGAGDWSPPDAAITTAAGPAWTAGALEARLRPALGARLDNALAPFVRGMRRRLERDHARLHAYHDDLLRDAGKRLDALAGAEGEKAEADRRREELRRQSVEREYAAKLDDLRHNYAMRVTVEWVQALELFLPVQRLEVLIRRRKGERVVRLDWHPLARALEPPPCDWGTGLERARLVCDERLHLTAPAGQDPCPNCGKPFCRACHPAACPRCGRAVTAGEQQSGPLHPPSSAAAHGE
jgi:hypothetical protein